MNGAGSFSHATQQFVEFSPRIAAANNVGASQGPSHSCHSPSRQSSSPPRATFSPSYSPARQSSSPSLRASSRRIASRSSTPSDTPPASARPASALATLIRGLLCTLLLSPIGRRHPRMPPPTLPSRNSPHSAPSRSNNPLYSSAVIPATSRPPSPVLALFSLLQTFGTVTQFKLVNNQRYAFVSYADHVATQNCVMTMNERSGGLRVDGTFTRESGGGGNG